MRDVLDHTVELLTDAAAVEALAREWNAFTQSLQPTLAHDWNVAALRASPAHAPRVVVVRRGLRPVAIAPLVLVQAGGIARLEIAAARAAYEPTGFLYLDAAALEALCNAVVKLRLPVELRRLPVGSAEVRLFAAAAAKHGKLLTLGAAPAPFVAIDRSWESFENGLSSRRRQDYRRLRRQLERAGTVSFDVSSPGPDTVAAELADSMRVEAAGWKGREGSALATHATLGVFFMELARRLAVRGTLRIASLRVDGKSIATQICIEDGDRWWVLKIGYDESWSDYSPGVQLMWDVLRHAFSRGLASAELLGTAEAWLGTWTTHERSYCTLALYPWTLRGMSALGADVAGVLWRKFVRKESR
jgi:CelD/BcsL family acetyltransferase involved in cellulose biosynthesis